LLRKVEQRFFFFPPFSFREVIDIVVSSSFVDREKSYFGREGSCFSYSLLLKFFLSLAMVAVPPPVHFLFSPSPYGLVGERDCLHFPP